MHIANNQNTNNKYFDKLESSHTKEYNITTYKNMFIEVYLWQLKSS